MLQYLFYRICLVYQSTVQRNAACANVNKGLNNCNINHFFLSIFALNFPLNLLKHSLVLADTKLMLERCLKPISTNKSSPTLTTIKERRFKRFGSLWKTVTTRQYLKRLEKDIETMKLQLELHCRRKVFETFYDQLKCPFMSICHVSSFISVRLIFIKLLLNKIIYRCWCRSSGCEDSKPNGYRNI